MPKSRLRFTVYSAESDSGSKEPQFSCFVDCQQCRYMISSSGKKEERRCKLRTCFLIPYCWIHTKKVYHLEYKKSGIEEAGKGLFAIKDFKAGAWIAPIWGERIDKAELDQRYDEITGPYAIDASEIKGEEYIDGACKRWIGHASNTKVDSRGRSSMKINNATIDYRGNRLWLRATKKISSGSEVFTYYGRAYDLGTEYAYRRR